MYPDRRKSRCSGNLPCKRCVDLSISCKYEFPHRRGQPSSPQRGFSTVLPDWGSSLPGSQAQDIQSLNGPDEVLADLSSGFIQPDQLEEAVNSSRSSPGRETTVLEDQYIGPTSGLAFLNRAKGRLKRDFSSSTRKGIDSPRIPSSIFNFGDKPYPSIPDSNFALPTRQQARDHVKRYFEFAVPTYRFLHQGTVGKWLENFIDENDAIDNGRKLLTNGKAAVVLMVLATSALYRIDEMATLHDAEAEEHDQR